jgi:hypothetical protein
VPWWPDVFRAALEDRLNLPTIKNISFIVVNLKEFPLSLLDNCKNIKKLCLMGSSNGGEARDLIDAQPRLQTMTLSLAKFLPISRLDETQSQGTSVVEVWDRVVSRAETPFRVSWSMFADLERVGR